MYLLCGNLKVSEKIVIMYGIFGLMWLKMVLEFYLKIKEEILLVYCLYFVGFLVRFFGGFDCEYLYFFLIYSKFNMFLK